MKKSPKKKTARKNKKYPALDPLYTTRIRREYLDMDYIDKLSEEEKAWLNKFTEENLNASFPKGEKHLNKAKKKKNQIYNENNARNRCIYGLAKSSNKLDEINYVEYEELSNSSNPEDAIIEYIDSKKEKED